jgi:hypothetical protein
MRRRLAIAIGVAGVACAGAAGLTLVARYRANRMVTPYDLATRSVEENARDGAVAGLTPVDVVGLRGLMRRPTEGHAWFIYWGGNTATYFKEAVATVRGLDLPPEIGVLIVAPPGYDSPGHPSPEEVVADAPRVREWLRQQEGADRIVLVGFSMGTYSALAAADEKVRGLVLMGNALSFDTGDRNLMVHFREPVRYRPPPVAPKVTALVIQGELDEAVGPEVATWLGARFVLVPHTHHEETPTNPLSLRETAAFLRERLLPEGSDGGSL